MSIRGQAGQVRSPLHRLNAIMQDLGATGGRMPRPCGDTAAATELALGPFSCHSLAPVDKVLALVPGTVYRVHVQVDADNGCFDHVFFVARGVPSHARTPCMAILDSYVDVRGVWYREKPLADPWLAQVLALGQVTDGGSLSRQWNALFHARETFVDPVAGVDIHVAVASPFVFHRVRSRSRFSP